MKRLLAWAGLVWLGFGLACWSTGFPLWVWTICVVPSTLLLAAREVADRRDVRARCHGALLECTHDAIAHDRAITALDRTIERIEADHA